LSLPLDDDTALDLLARRLLAADHPTDDAPFSDFDLSGGRPITGTLTEAAVLVPVVRRASGLMVILTQRSSDMPTHAGQIAFPGGRRQPEDRSLAATALREAHEEIGLDPAFVTVLGASDAYQTVTRYRVTPVVGLVVSQAAITADPREVADVFEVPLAHFMNPANHERHSRDWNGQARHYYAMPWQGRYVWGATAGMLRALYLRLIA
jgi:8-oxo-dGTP pyrophosphatase MutT (NUDIX family)